MLFRSFSALHDVGKAIDLPAYSYVKDARSCTLSPGHGDSQHEGFTAVPDNSAFYNSTIVYKYNQCHYPMSLIKYIPVHSTQRPKSPSSAPTYSTLPGQPIPYLSLASLPIPFYRAIRLSPCNHPVPHLTIRGPFPIRC